MPLAVIFAVRLAASMPGATWSTLKKSLNFSDSEMTSNIEACALRNSFDALDTDSTVCSLALFCSLRASVVLTIVAYSSRDISPEMYIILALSFVMADCLA